MTRSRSVQAQVLVVGGLLAAAGLAWWSTAARMEGMTAAPDTDLGTVGWFTVTWAVMMTAMMLPSLAPADASTAVGRVTVASRSVLFAGGYLFVWTLAGVAVYDVLAVASSAAGLAWASGGRWVSVGVLMLASTYELTAIKRTFLARCRRAPAKAPSSARYGVIVEGMSAGVCCLGCSWALMAALFALGVMSLTWMALVAALVAFEKLAQWPWAGIVLAAIVLTALAFGVAAFPQNVPGLVVPASHGSMTMMSMTSGQQ
jgi:predicted metal-binding membrane protein